MPSRESELYKDKVEVSLDGRQIFYLFFGGAVIIGIVFVLGVLVGRRVEARGHVDRARTTAAADPLAALDRLEDSGGMAFRGALTGKEATAPVEKKIDQIAADKKKAEPSAKKDDAKKEEAKKDEPKKEDAKKDEPKKEEAKKDEPKKEEAKKDEKKTEKTEKTEQASAGDKPIEKPSETKREPAPEPKEDKTRYTLQLSSFQDKAEAEAYLAKVKEQGYAAQITQAEVEGRGTFYRVRMGSYRSLDAATTAKTDFEKASNKSASIMKL
ncbi:MAG: SPOR domain-containing protein [Kofleriaceae bacterium]